MGVDSSWRRNSRIWNGICMYELSFTRKSILKISRVREYDLATVSVHYRLFLLTSVFVNIDREPCTYSIAPVFDIDFAKIDQSSTNIVWFRKYRNVVRILYLRCTLSRRISPYSLLLRYTGHPVYRLRRQRCFYENIIAPLTQSVTIFEEKWFFV